MSKLPKPKMKVRNKTHHSPEIRIPPSSAKLFHASQRGKKAWKRLVSILDNPYPPGLLHNAWREGYMSAMEWKLQPVQLRAPEGVEIKPYGYVESKPPRFVRSKGKKKFKIKDTSPKPPKETKFNYYLGYIKPPSKRFRIWTRNPPPPKEKKDD